MSVEDITNEAHFNELVASNQRVLIDFWAPWCRPCQTMAKTFKQVADERTPALKAIKVNIDELPMLAQKYSIRSIPSLVLLKEGAVVSEHLGATPKQEILQWLNNYE